MSTYRALLHRFSLTCDDPVAEEYLRLLLAPLRDQMPGWDETPGPVTEYRLARGEASTAVTELTVGGEAAADGLSARGAIGRFLSLIDRDAERVTGARYPVLHAAACHRDGRTVVIPGAPNAGKSTLMAHLALSGWTYLSDELVAIVPGAPPTLIAYPRSVVLDEGSWPLFTGQMIQPPAELSSQLPNRRHLRLPDGCLPRSGARYPITDISFYRWQAGAEAQARELDAVESLRGLLGSSFSLDDSPRRDLAVLGHVVDDAACWRVLGGQLDAVQHILLGPPSEH